MILPLNFRWVNTDMILPLRQGVTFMFPERKLRQMLLRVRLGVRF
jgi:hypothetical protein